MNAEFSRTLSLLRQEKGLSQRSAAQALGISQALLSHYEKGIREPGLAFVVRACDYYNVSADFLLGRTLSRDGTTIIEPDELYDASSERDTSMRGSVLALLNKKLLVNSIGLLFDLLGKVGDRRAIRSACAYLSTAVYNLFRLLHRASGTNPGFFSVSSTRFSAGLTDADMSCSRVEFVEALSDHGAAKGEFPPMSNDDLARDYPVLYQSLLQIIHHTGARVNQLSDGRNDK
ncbi:MAG: helix-turn-helix transcriptional regulator [Ruminococcaceae bacterium]|nr:helix-turn-helix transcriptional regulator [Oscillospiraceae bacterium]